MRKYLDIIESNTRELDEVSQATLDSVATKREEQRQDVIADKGHGEESAKLQGKVLKAYDHKPTYKRKTLEAYLQEVEALHEGYSANTIANLNVHEFIEGYIKCMLWSSTDNEEHLDQNYSESDISHEALDKIEADCRSFLHSAGPFITADRYKGAKIGSLELHAGHDFWLTRVGHGSGFWDGDWAGEENGMEGPLTKAAKAFGNVDPYVGDDGKIHLM